MSQIELSQYKNISSVDIYINYRILRRGSIIKHVYDTPTKTNLVEYLFLITSEVDISHGDVCTEKNITYTFKNCINLNTSRGCVFHETPEGISKGIESGWYTVIRYGAREWRKEFGPKMFKEILGELTKKYLPCQVEIRKDLIDKRDRSEL